MRVLMLGWEFPPHISGGLGTACFGLTRALSRQGVDVTFILPRPAEQNSQDFVNLLSPDGSTAPASPPPKPKPATPQLPAGASPDDFDRVRFEAVPSKVTNPYGWVKQRGEAPPPLADQPGQIDIEPDYDQPSPGHYEGDLYSAADAYARLCLDKARGVEFDVIHAHDWLTYPAGLAIAAATSKPLIAHVHSTEYDRAGGEGGDERVHAIEREGIAGATGVIAVSKHTRRLIEDRYGASAENVSVVYNGIDDDPLWPDARPLSLQIEPKEKIVLFLGRVTMQKGPDYFIRAAKKVLEKVEHVKFVVAGSGDMLHEVTGLANREGVEDRVLFTGFLSGSDVQRVYEMADVYVMPSVSEPFGIAALEAIRHDVPVIVSRSAGVSEVLQHVLKVDFWDVDQIADRIVAVLRHPPLSDTIRAHADREIQALTWDRAAQRCVAAYEKAMTVAVGA